MDNPIKIALMEGISYSEIRKRFGVSKSTISYHAKAIGVSRKRTDTKYDWSEVQKFLDAGNSRTDAIKHFGFAKKSWADAVSRGALIYTAPDKTAAIKKSLEFGYPHHRGSLKAFIRKHNLIPYVCQDCGQLPKWNGKDLVLQLEHKNGVNNDNRLENLCFLCPNCHSQTETFAGKKRK